MKCIDIINDALYSIGATSDINPASPEMINASFRRLIMWVNQLAADGIDLGIPTTHTPPTAPGDELGNLSAYDLALSAGFAPWVAPIFQIILKPEAKNTADHAMQTLYAAFMKPSAPDYPETLPVGSGNNRGPWGRVFYPVPDYLNEST